MCPFSRSLERSLSSRFSLVRARNYGGCLNAAANGMGNGNRPVMPSVCRACGTKTAGPCLNNYLANNAPCQPTTTNGNNRLMLHQVYTPTSLLWTIDTVGCGNGAPMCHVCGGLNQSPCNGSEQGTDGACDAGLHPRKNGGHTCTASYSMVAVNGVYYHTVGQTPGALT